jgi:mannose-6-phosphate isomerase-like protein (cupin superfamily)
MSGSEKLTNFGHQETPVHFVETITVKEGVECDVYSFDDDSSKDLAIVRVSKGAKTPLQKVLSGLTTTEGFLTGKGTLTIQSPDGQETSYAFDEQNQGEAILVEVGQIMQWTAGQENELIFYEVCVPPYRDGRFENLPE